METKAGSQVSETRENAPRYVLGREGVTVGTGGWLREELDMEGDAAFLAQLADRADYWEMRESVRASEGEETAVLPLEVD